ncbi:MAG TPA: aminotransferase class I/II-fold pyridoxal phosphate-dependent enzyme, partial [Chitinophagales bacterium]|nr:aminotransferase class I/II-fold pyridoxal phosphate-dependent enzyme [Chitinophagales bacterium]
MSNSIESYIISKLAERKTANNFRALKPVAHLVDFYSNDYLGFASDGVLKEKIRAEITAYPYYGHGSTGSRLLSGNNEYAEKLETLLAQFHHAEAALLFNSGFDANYGLLSALPYKGDTIIYDELVHASVHDGMRNSKADALPFSHNNITALEEKLAGAKGLKYVVVES